MTAVSAVNPKLYFPSCPGGSVDVYLAGTTSRSNSWQDRNQTTLNTNPIVLDSRGECVAWLDSSKRYKFVVKNSSGVTVYTVDNVAGAQPGAASVAQFTTDTFSGTGAQTAFTLSVAPSHENATNVFVSGVYQKKSTYDISGTTLTFTAAPASGTNNIEVMTASILDYTDVAADIAASVSAASTSATNANNSETNAANSASAAATSATNAANSEAGAAAIVLGNFTATGTGAEARTFLAKARDFVSVLDFIPVAEHAAIAAGTSTYDCYASIMEAINSVTYIGTWIGSTNRAGPSIYFPPGIYKVNSTIELKKRVTLWGDGSGMAYGDAAILYYPADTIGIRVQYLNTLTDTVDGAGNTTEGGASVIRGLALVSAGGVSTTKHAIWLRARAYIENVYIENFAGDGYHIEASVGGGGSAEGNANNWQIRGGRVNDCSGHGIYVDGADSNAGCAIGVDIVNNGGWGIFDSSFLGNTYVAIHTSANTSGAYKTDNANARNIFIGCYSEGGQPASDIVKPTIFLGGISGSDFTAGSTAQMYHDNGMFTVPGSAAFPSHSFAEDKDTGWYSVAANILGLAIGGSNRARFTNAAKFSTSGSYFGSGNDYHEFVQSAANLASSYDYLTSTSYTGLGKVVNCATASGTGFNLISLQNAGGVAFTVVGNGNAQNTNNSYGAISDAKLKENIAAAPSYWDKFKRYEFVNYTLKADEKKEKLLGLVAQQAEEVCPGVVYETPDFAEVVSHRHGERNVDRVPTGTVTKAVKYSVVALQAEVVLQEAQRRIEQLEAQVASLLAK